MGYVMEYPQVAKYSVYKAACEGHFNSFKSLNGNSCAYTCLVFIPNRNLVVVQEQNLVFWKIKRN